MSNNWITIHLIQCYAEVEVRLIIMVALLYRYIAMYYLIH